DGIRDLIVTGVQTCALPISAYRQVKASGLPIEPLGVKFDIPIGNKIVRGRLLRGVLPGSDVPIFFVEQDDYYDRPELYRQKGEEIGRASCRERVEIREVDAS